MTYIKVYLQLFRADDIHSLVERDGHVDELESHLFTRHALNARTLTDDVLRHADASPKAH